MNLFIYLTKYIEKSETDSSSLLLDDGYMHNVSTFISVNC
jgi:hypothetical protein